MSWARLDDRLYDDPRCEKAGLDAMGLYLLGLSYMAAYSTEGRISPQRIRRLAGRRGPWLAKRLVDAGLWTAEGEEFVLVDWQSQLLTRVAQEERSRRAADAGRKGGLARAAAASEGTRTPPEGGAENEPHPEPRANLGAEVGGLPEDNSEVQTRNPAESLDTGQATRARSPVPIPTHIEEEEEMPEKHAPEGDVLVSPPRKRTKKTAVATPGVEAVFAAYVEAWREHIGRGAAPILTSDRVKLVLKRIEDGFTVEQLVMAARGVFRSDWHVQKGYTSLDTALADAERVERFSAAVDSTPPASDPLAGKYGPGRTERATIARACEMCGALVTVGDPVVYYPGSKAVEGRHVVRHAGCAKAPPPAPPVIVEPRVYAPRPTAEQQREMTLAKLRGGGLQQESR